MGNMMGKDRTFSAADAKGGQDINPKTTAVLCIEFQNEFTTDGEGDKKGKLYDGVKGVMESTGMLDKSVDVCAATRRGRKGVPRADHLRRGQFRQPK